MSNKQQCDDWSLNPLQGLGRLKFGMSREEAAEFDSIYGVPDLVLPNGNMVKESRQNGDLQILFIDNKLKEIMIILPFEQLCFAGKQIGGMEGFYIVEHMMKMMDEAPVALNNDLVFQKACLSLWDLTYTWGDKAYVLRDYDDEAQASITLMADLDGHIDLSKYIPVPPNPTPYG